MNNCMESVLYLEGTIKASKGGKMLCIVFSQCHLAVDSTYGNNKCLGDPAASTVNEAAKSTGAEVSSEGEAEAAKAAVKNQKLKGK